MEILKDYCKNRKLITLICDCCGKEFQKPLSEYNRNVKLGRKNYCSRICSGKSNKNLSLSNEKYDISQHSGNRRDEFSPFRYTMRCIKRRSKEINIDLEYLKLIWEQQNGICPYTNLKLTLPEDNNINDLNIIYRASLDRIDSSKGYIKGNVQFVSTPINLMKQQMSDLETKKFLKQISSYTSTFIED